ncbi:hypothetical protein J2799_002333 [Chryseobacterium vietnamense]|uniref:hypothetical protein n=1 Tax=Chryseobacterium vietnamense TaxID=866785 RepID=UPI00285F198B|nr:hypothetical protein [Chryseobacterium vietnamense]MDR6487828.1 hypothetical protein [Chryseobacterium vietnamense]
MMSTSFALAQVGINTSNAQSTLDIVGNPNDTTKIDGIIAPRITGNQLAAKDALYTVAQTGAMVYVTAAANPTTPKTINVTSPGYYTFNGNLWTSSSNNTGGTLVSYEALVSGNPVAYPGNNTGAALDISIGTGTLASWRTNNTTLTVPTGKAGRYIVSFTGGVKVLGSVPSSYSFFIYLNKNGGSLTTGTPGCTIPQTSGAFTSAIFSLSWSEILDLNDGDTISFTGLTFGATGTPQSFRLSNVSIQKVN